MRFKKLFSLALAGVFAFGFFSGTQAATREEISEVKVSKAGNFKFWEKDSESAKKLVEYVKDVTNPKSKNFIPIEDRIATFDMDGTIFCETAPSYFWNMIFIQRTLHDENFQADSATKEYAQSLEDFNNGKISDYKHGISEPYKAEAFKNMNYAEYTEYVQNFYENTSVTGLSNLKWGEAFYLPMVEVIRYLQANNFKVYVVSGTDRQLIRVLLGDIFKIPSEQIIGSDINILAANQGDKKGEKYDYTHNDYLVRGDFFTKTIKMNKVVAIDREIGKQPVLAFGNSDGDTSMLNYAITNNKYKSLAFFVLCDDLERELGNLKKADKCKKMAENNGWTSISMRDDWKTIYGENVEVEK